MGATGDLWPGQDGHSVGGHCVEGCQCSDELGAGETASVGEQQHDRAERLHDGSATDKEGRVDGVLESDLVEASYCEAINGFAGEPRRDGHYEQHPQSGPAGASKPSPSS